MRFRACRVLERKMKHEMATGIMYGLFMVLKRLHVTGDLKVFEHIIQGSCRFRR